MYQEAAIKDFSGQGKLQTVPDFSFPGIPCGADP
jgi:hypothetical protein